MGKRAVQFCRCLLRSGIGAGDATKGNIITSVTTPLGYVAQLIDLTPIFPVKCPCEQVIYRGAENIWGNCIQLNCLCICYREERDHGHAYKLTYRPVFCTIFATVNLPHGMSFHNLFPLRKILVIWCNLGLSWPCWVSEQHYMFQFQYFSSSHWKQ